jgi:hypothetical protein
MKQEKVTRKELLAMEIGATSTFFLIKPEKLQSVASTCSQLKNEGKGEWSVDKDYEHTAVKVTRIR